MSTPVPVPLPVTVGAIPWWQSAEQRKKIVTAVLIGVAMMPASWKVGIVAQLGLDNVDTVAGYVTDAAGTAALANTIWAFIKRFFSKEQPLTGSTAAAATHPSTVAVVLTQTAMKAAGIPTAANLAAEIVTDRNALKSVNTKE